MACLAQILYPPPTKTGWDEWLQAHASHHEAIEDGIATKFGVSPITFNLYPLFKQDMDRWLQTHVAAHQRMRQYLSFGGNDLSNLQFDNKSAFDDWVWENYIDHFAAASRLGTIIT